MGPGFQADRLGQRLENLADKLGWAGCPRRLRRADEAPLALADVCSLGQAALWVYAAVTSGYAVAFAVGAVYDSLLGLGWRPAFGVLSWPFRRALQVIGGLWLLLRARLNCAVKKIEQARSDIFLFVHGVLAPAVQVTGRALALLAPKIVGADPFLENALQGLKDWGSRYEVADLVVSGEAGEQGDLTSTMRLAFETTMERRRNRASQCRWRALSRSMLCVSALPV